MKVLGCIGGGGMGEIYAAVDAATDDEFVVKVPAARESATAAAWVIDRELRFPAGLRHPHVVARLDHGEVNGVPFLVMEFVDGSDLDVWARCAWDTGQGPAWRAVCELISQAADGLAAAHDCGMVHRDVKPANLIRRSDGMVKVLDWGLVRLSNVDDRDTPQTTAEDVLGTWDYMAPEQAADPRTATASSDLYSLGCTLFFLLTGRPPFGDAVTRLAKLQAHKAAARPSVRRYRRDVPRRIDRLVQRLMAVDPKDRFVTARTFVRALRRETATGPRGVIRRLANRAGVIAARQSGKALRDLRTFGLILLLVASAWGLWHLVDPEPPPEYVGTPTGGQIAIPAGLRQKDPELVALVIETSAFDDEERQRWISRIGRLSRDERQNLYGRLTLIKLADIRGGVIVPQELRDRFPRLVELILTSEAMDDRQRNECLSLLYVMNDEQRGNVQDILEREQDELRLIDREFTARKDLGPVLDLTALITLAGSPDARDRKSAAIGLKQHGQHEEAVVPVLIKLLKDPDEQVRLLARMALAKVAPQHLRTK